MIGVRSVFAVHEIGRRQYQQDSIWPKKGFATTRDRLFIVCDGVGGGAKGEIASDLTSKILGEGLSLTEGNLDDQIVSLCDKAAKELHQYSELNANSELMATTLTLAALLEDRVVLAWCGDSRIMHIRDGSVMYETADHSLVAELVRRGELSPEEARSHPQKNLITRSIHSHGTPVEVEFVTLHDVLPGDFILLCSDGVLENLTEEIIAMHSQGWKSGDAAKLSFFNELCFGKTKDNYSMYLIELV